ncbi:MAG: NADH-quinone oxidoreductase subunit J [Shewanella sp.]
MYLSLLGSAVVFISLRHPIGLGLALIVHTLLVSAATGLVGGHFWFSYILFLVFLGGVLVLFIYMTSLASNEKFEIS